MNEPRRCSLSAALPLAPLLLLALPHLASAAERPIVRKIDIRGYRGDPAAIKDIIKTTEGAPLDRDTLDNDLRRLLKAGFLAEERIQPLPDGVRVIFTIIENPRVRKIAIKGAGRSWGGTLRREEILTRPGDPILPAVLKLPEEQRFRADKARILAFCQRRGYRDVTVVSRATPVPGTNQVDITFEVKLGPKYQVKWLRFRGNRSIRSRELRRLMRTKRDTLFTSRRYNENVFKDDIENLQEYYRFKGFPNAKVTYDIGFKGPRRNRVAITIKIDERQRFPTATIDIKGNKAITTDDLLAAIPLKVAGPYSDEKLEESRLKMARLYMQEGYPYIAISPGRQLNAKGDAYDVTFDIEEGERITINIVATPGLTRTRKEVILRELELEPGMVYDIKKLERSQRALERLRFFDEVTLKLKPTDPEVPGQRDLVVEVKEGRTGHYRFGLGFSSPDGLVGLIDMTQDNFERPKSWFELLNPRKWADLVTGRAYVGGGEYFRVALMPGLIYNRFLIDYENPYWRGRNQSFGWRFYFRTRDQGEWDERRIGLRLSWGRRKFRRDPDTDLIYHVRLESVSVLNVDAHDAPKDAVDEEGSHFLLGLGATLRRDKTDRPALPTAGYRGEGGLEIVVPHGLKLGFGATRYWSLGKRPPGHERVLSVRGRFDYALGRFPIYERFYAGAPLIRGFAYRGAGPHDNDEPEGGHYRVLLSAEYRYPLVPKRLYGVYFCDAGTVTKRFSLLGSPRLSVGFGLRLLLPGLSRAPVRLDFGVPILKQAHDDTELIYLSVSIDR